MLVEKGLSGSQIADEIVSSKSAVLDALRKHGIPIREAHKGHGRKSQVKFGERKVKDKVRTHEREQTVIAVIMKMHAEGMSFRKICTILTEMKIATKQKGRKWHPEMVRRILSG